MNKDNNIVLYTVIAKDSSWFAKLDEDGVKTMLEESAIQLKEGKETTYQTLLTDKELKTYIKMREREKCIYCEKNGNRIHWLLSKEHGGFETPINLVLTCEECRKVKKEQCVENMEEYLEETKGIKERNKKIMQNKVGILCESCKEDKDMESLKYVNKAGTIAYCVECFEQREQNIYFLFDEENDYMGATSKEHVQELWNEGKVEYLDKNIAKVFLNSKKQRCLLCRKMKWKSSFKKNEHNEKKSFCRKCQLERAEEGVYVVYDNRHQKMDLISSVEAKKLIKRGFGKIISDNGFKITSILLTHLYQARLFYQNKIKKEEKYFILSFSGKTSKRITQKEKDHYIKEKKAESHTEQIIRSIVDNEEF